MKNGHIGMLAAKVLVLISAVAGGQSGYRVLQMVEEAVKRATAI